MSQIEHVNIEGKSRMMLTQFLIVTCYNRSVETVFCVCSVMRLEIMNTLHDVFSLGYFTSQLEKVIHIAYTVLFYVELNFSCSLSPFCHSYF